MKPTTLIIIQLALLTTLSLLILALYHIKNLKRQAKERTEHYESLMQSLQQKNELLELAQNIQDEKISLEVREIADKMGAESKLTRRELEIANLITDGLLNKEIAYKLNISVRTVENHRNSIYHKLGVSNAVELVKCLGRS